MNALMEREFQRHGGDTPNKCGTCMSVVELQHSGHGKSIELIDLLDLSMIKMKLCLPIEDEGKGWSLDRANRCERLYKMFLKLNILYQEVSVVPTKEIDDMWHAHILDTRKYHEDCQKIFGFYFHHFPYFGLRGEEDKANLYHAFDVTKSLFAQHFGEDLTRAEGEATCGNRNCNGCRNRGV